jgi:WD40 repeat protein
MATSKRPSTAASGEPPAKVTWKRTRPAGDGCGTQGADATGDGAGVGAGEAGTGAAPPHASSSAVSEARTRRWHFMGGAESIIGIMRPLALAAACGIAVGCAGSPPAVYPPPPAPAPSATAPVVDTPPPDPVYEPAAACSPATPGDTTTSTSNVQATQVVQGRNAGALQALAFSPTGLLATVGDDFTLRIWDASQRFLLRAMHLPTMPLVPNLTWDAKGEHVIVTGIGSRDTFDLHGVASPRVEKSLAFPDGKTHVAFDVGLRSASPAGGLAAVVRDPVGTSRFGPYGPPSVVYWPSFDAPGQSVSLANAASVTLNGRGDTLAATVVNGDKVESFTSDVYSIATASPGQPSKVWTTDGWARVLAVSPDGHAIALAVHPRDQAHFYQPKLVLLDATRGAVVWTRAGEAEDERGNPAKAQLEIAAFSPTEPLLAVATQDGRVQTYETGAGRYEGSLGIKPRHPDLLTLVRDDVVAAITKPKPEAGTEGHVALWSLRDGTVLRSQVAHGELVGAAPNGDVQVPVTAHLQRCNKDGRTLSFESWAGALPAAPGLPIDVSSRCVDGLFGVVDGRVAASQLLVNRNLPDKGEGNGNAKNPRYVADHAIYDMKTNVMTPLEKSALVFISGTGGLGLSPDGRWVIEQTANDDPSYTIWDTRTGRIARTGIGLKRTKDAKPAATAVAVVPGKEKIAVAYSRAVSVQELRTGRELAHLDLDDEATAVQFTPDGARLVVTDQAGAFYVFKGAARVARGTSDATGAFAIAIDSAGRTAVTIAGDDAVRVWDIDHATVRASLAEFADDEYAAFTPHGAYSGTSEVADRIGWVFDGPTEGFSFEQFAGSFRSDDIVRKRLAGDPADTTALVARPPRVTVPSPPPSRLAAATTTVHAHASSGDRVDLVRAYVEARPVAEKAVCAKEGDVDLDVPLLPGINRVTLVAFDSHGAASNPVAFDVTSTRTDAQRPDVWVVAVGVNRYKNLPDKLQLDAADDDAKGVAAAFSALEGSTYGKAHATTLTDTDASPASIAAAVSGLSAMRRNDVAIVFFAGHGFKPSASADMVFVTGGAELRPDGQGLTDESVKRDGVAWTEIAAALGKAKGRVVVMLDACHSGHVSQSLVVPNEALASALARDQRAGEVVFAASKGRQLSLEGGTSRGLTLDTSAPGGGPADVRFSQAEPHGFFTGALLAAMSDPASDRNGDGFLQLSEVIDEVTRRVTRQSRSRQTPWIARRELFGDFALAPAAKAAP